MLTRQDRTITDCLELFDLIRPLRLRHVGFKDIGVPPETLTALTEAIRAEFRQASGVVLTTSI